MKETISKLYHFHNDSIQTTSNPESLKALYREFFDLSDKIGKILGEENKGLIVSRPELLRDLADEIFESDR